MARQNDILLLVLAATLVGSAQVAALRIPVDFDATTSGVLHDVYESYRLDMKLEEREDSPIVFEAEHASKISLHGAERLAHLPDAVGGMAVWQLKQIWLNFSTLAPGEYTAWYRCKARPGYGVSGPFRASVDNGRILEPKVVPRRSDKQGCWMWLKGNRYKLNAGMHHFQIRANLVFYGACIDRIVWTKDEAYRPADEDTGPPETATVALPQGSATSGAIDLKGVRRWKRILCRQVTCGGRVSWAFRPVGADDWQPIAPDDVSAIPAHKPFQLRMTLTASADGKTPFVDTVRLEYDGEPLSKELSSGVLYTATRGGGCEVTTDIYSATFGNDGEIASLKLFGNELIAAGEGEGSGWGLQFTPWADRKVTRHVPLGRADLTTDGTIARRTDETTQLFEFGRSKITVRLSSFGGQTLNGRGTIAHAFKLNPELAVDRIIEQGTGDVAPPGTAVTPTPQVFLKDGSSFIVNPVSVRLPAHISYPGGPDGPTRIEWRDNRENHNTIGITFTLKPGDSPLLAADVVCAPPDHDFRAGEPVRILTNSLIPRGLGSFTGTGRLVLDELYAPQDRTPERIERTLAFAGYSEEQARGPLTWVAELTRPGHYYAEYQLLKDGKTLRSSWFFLIYGAKTNRAESRPEDLDAFWGKAMRELAALPATFSRLTTKEQAGSVASRITFKTIGGKDAWGRLTEPAEEGQFPAVLELPAVFHHFGGRLVPARRKGFVTLGCDVMGFDPDEVDPFSSAGRAVYQPWQRSIVDKPEDFWLYYAYCTIARGYDILAAHPKVDPERVYITGLSQGGGLTIAAASLRPQNAGALSIVPGICRIAWGSVSEGRGAWGPRFELGPDYERMAAMAQYFETAHLVKALRNRFVMFIGLRDDHTPPFAAATVFHHVPEDIRERKLIVDPWAHHHGRSDLATYIPRWAREDLDR